MSQAFGGSRTGGKKYKNGVISTRFLVSLGVTAGMNTSFPRLSGKGGA